MNRWKLIALLFASTTALLWTYLDSTHGQRSRGSRIHTPNTNVELRISSLEQRVLVLETLLAVRSTPVSQTDALNTKSIEQWERDLETSEQRLEHSTRMERKGYLTRFALFEDQLAGMGQQAGQLIDRGRDQFAERAQLQLFN